MFSKLLIRQRPTHQLIFALVATLLLAQLLVITHFHKEVHHAPDSICSVCLTGQHFNHALGHSLVLFQNPGEALPYYGVFTNLYVHQFVPAFHSRAPPVLL